jgi:hypothetical protein
MPTKEEQSLAEGILPELYALRRSLMRERIECTDVRLQLFQPGDWAIREGDPGYDTDHSGYWGAGAVAHDSTDEDLRSTALDLAQEALDGYYSDQFDQSQP